ncbi:hypothetical protein H1R20_g13845, partial [Candolleomyces eurysporus]
MEYLWYHPSLPLPSFVFTVNLGRQNNFDAYKEISPTLHATMKTNFSYPTAKLPKLGVHQGTRRKAPVSPSRKGWYVGTRKDMDEAKAARAGKPQKAESITGTLNIFIVEPFFLQPSNTKYHVFFVTKRDATRSSSPMKVHLRRPPLRLPRYQPLVISDAVNGGQLHVCYLDLAAKLNQTAESIRGPKEVAGCDLTVYDAAAKVNTDRGPLIALPPSLAVLNPEGCIWSMVADGGADSDTIAARGGILTNSPGAVGGIKPGYSRIGNSRGMMDNIVASKLYRPSSVGYVSKSGGTSNEHNILTILTYEGIAIGSDRFPGTTLHRPSPPLRNCLRVQDARPLR